ncbi:DUF2784 domain-containing protein [Nocardiopsis ansamitocini]|uniref:DUF2784 domain-containing protein n=1 Tax=Nocardiopsis ansamitocini TaxID=1670832 RepID=UPI002553D69B|nr:DUF2784 domain-containing protein [Nocardiopsis ansamitocini]
MGYHVLGEAAMVMHFAFLGYVVAGGFLAWRWPRAIWPHMAFAVYALGIVVIGWDCPLTGLEYWARSRAGEQGLTEEGFIAHYLTGVLYPEQYLVLAQAAVATTVALSWAGAAWLTTRRNRARLVGRR